MVIDNICSLIIVLLDVYIYEGLAVFVCLSPADMFIRQLIDEGEET